MISHNDAVKRALLTLSACGVRLPCRREVGLFTDLRGNKRQIGVKGEADVQGVLPPSGRKVAVEIKTGNATRTTEQERWAEAFVAAGGLYVLARYSETLDGDATIRAAIEEARA